MCVCVCVWMRDGLGVRWSERGCSVGERDTESVGKCLRKGACACTYKRMIKKRECV